MKILRHFSANDEQLTLLPFKRELSMESYLIENEQILTLDNDTFYDVDIIEEELTLKEGRSSQNTDGRIDILITYAQEYIGVVELKLGELNEVHLEQLEDYLVQKQQILDKYPNLFNQETMLEPKWIGVLVGDSITSALSEKISNGYATKQGVPIAALTIQRFRSVQSNVYVTTDTYFKNTLDAKDRTQYKFNDNLYGKGRLVLAVIKQYVEDSPNITFAELERNFPKSCQSASLKGEGILGVFTTLEKAEEIALNGRKRHFLGMDEKIQLESGVVIAVCNQWGVGNVDKFISRAREFGCQID